MMPFDPTDPAILKTVPRGLGFDPAATAAAPQIPNAEELYNALMREIEPELTTDHIPLLEGKYIGETSEQARARAERYEQAFTEYRKRLNAYMVRFEEKVRAYQRNAMASVEREERLGEENILDNLQLHMASA